MAVVDTSKGYVYWSVLPDSNVLGGRARAATAVRSKKGVMLPNDFAAQLEWEDDPNHGSRGGTANVQTCNRNRGKFAKKGGQS